MPLGDLRGDDVAVDPLRVRPSFGDSATLFVAHRAVGPPRDVHRIDLAKCSVGENDLAMWRNEQRGSGGSGERHHDRRSDPRALGEERGLAHPIECSSPPTYRRGAIAPREKFAPPPRRRARHAILRSYRHLTRRRCARRIRGSHGPGNYEFQSDFFKKHLKEHRAAGKADGEATAVLTVLDARGIAVSAEQKERILGCSDVALLDRWIRKAVIVASAEEIGASCAPSPRR
ncbi:MAG: hypothetical protein KF837_32135 [Labilithrix sp.]|nr:hypothetical protein [Labilithrix sp.]